jgi:uncharacterized phage-associated protein
MLYTQKDIAFTKDQVEKIGNTIVYLSQKINDLNKTKILKILFLLEEASIKKYGYPFFGIDFQLWKHGPVAKDIFIDLSEDVPSLLGKFIKRDESNAGAFVAIEQFNDDEFSDNDIDLLDKVTAFAKNQTASSLVKYTHDYNSLWRKSAIQNGVLDLLENQLVNSTEFTIDFGLLFENNPDLLEQFKEAKENREFVKHLKS